MSENNERVGDGMVVELEYVLTNDAGEVLDQSEPDDPLSYLHGAENIVPGLERAIRGKAVGESLHVDLSPADGYGEKSNKKPIAIPRKEFPKNMVVEPEMPFVLEDQRGRPVQVWVTSVDERNVFCSEDHPLAGQALHFDVKIVSIRPASDEEKEHGHPHGPDGHGHHHH